MKIVEYISPLHRKILLAVGLITFICSMASAVAYDIKAEQERTEYYREQEQNKVQGKPVFAGPYCFPDRHSELLLKIIFFSGLTSLLLCFSKKYFFSFFSNVALCGLFINWFMSSQKLINNAAEFESVEGINRFILQGGNFDVAVFCLASMLLFWQIVILSRSLITTQRKSIMP